MMKTNTLELGLNRNILKTPRHLLSYNRRTMHHVYERQLTGLSPSPRQDVLNFLSINVEKGGTIQDIALARACEIRIDVLLVQEPWWSGRTKTHPNFDLYLAYGGDDIRPRAVTYIRKDPQRINSVQKYPHSPSGDYCWVEVNGVMFLNVYKAPHDPSAVQPLLDWTPIGKIVAIGDFNSVYWAWQPRASSFYGQGEEIQRWAKNHNLTCLIVDEATHRAGNTLDLAWTNITKAMAWVGIEECVTSDHLPICGFVPNPKGIRKDVSSDVKIRVSKAKLPQFAQVVSQWLPPLKSLKNSEETENFAREILWALENALKAIGKRSNRKSARSTSWWSHECKLAHLDYRQAGDDFERIERAKSFRKNGSFGKKRALEK